MSQGRIKDPPATVPERAKPRDATIVVVPPSARLGPCSPPGPGREHLLDSVAPLPLDSYQPPCDPADALAGPASQREQIVPSGATVGSIIDNVRKRPAERLEIEARLDS